MPSAAGSVKNVDKTDILESDSVWTGQLTAENINATGGTIAGFEISDEYEEITLSSSDYTVTVTRTVSVTGSNRYNYTALITLVDTQNWDSTAVVQIYDNSVLVATLNITIAAGETSATGLAVVKVTDGVGTITNTTTVSYVRHLAYLTYNKETYDDENTGVYLGIDGIGLGEGTFWVNDKGEFNAENAYIKGEIIGTYVTADVLSVDSAIFNEMTAGKILGGNGSYLDFSTLASGYNTVTATIEDCDKSSLYSIKGEITFDYSLTADKNFTLYYKVKNSWTGKISIRSQSVTVSSGNSSYSFSISIDSSGTTQIYSAQVYLDEDCTTTSTTFTQNSETGSEIIMANGNILPSVKGSYNLGANGTAWLYVYSSTTGNTSDKKLKENIEDLSLNLSMELIKNITPREYYFKTDIDKRLRYGFIAQEVEEMLNDIGLSAKDNSLVLKTDIDKPDSENNFYSLNYIDLIAPIIKVLQDVLMRVEYMENKLLNNSNKYYI